MKKETLISDIKNIENVLAGIRYASFDAPLPEKYVDDEEFMIGYNMATRLRENNTMVPRKVKRGPKASRKCK